MMRTMSAVVFGLVVAAFAVPAHAEKTLTAQQILDKLIDSDPWGLSGTYIKAHAVQMNKQKKERTLKFTAISWQYQPKLSKSLIRVLGPADIKGVGFLLVQHADRDDDRHLYLPKLKRSRRIAGDFRSGAFLRTEFSYGDLDRRDLRKAKAKLKGEEKIGKHLCYLLEVTATDKNAHYARQELWVRKDNFMPLKIKMYNKGGVHIKSLQVKQVKRIKGQWYTTKTLMMNHQNNRSTELFLDNIKPRKNFTNEDFTIRALEKS